MGWLNLLQHLWPQRTRNTDPADGILNQQELDFDNPPPCPRCQSTDVATILYGKPPLTRQILAGLDSGKIISGGCMLHGGAPQWHCHGCKRDFGHRNLPKAKKGTA